MSFPRALFLPILLSALGSLSILPGCAPGKAENQGEEASSDSIVEAILGSAAESPPSREDFSPRLSPQEQQTRPLDIAQMGFDLGSSDAPVRVLELSDFGCGYCRLFQEETFPTLHEAYVEEGLVQWKFVPFVLGMFPNGLEAAIAGECAGEQDRFFPLQKRLFQQQSAWKDSQEPFPLFSELATEAGLDVERFNRCLEGGWRENQVRSNVLLGRQLGVRGTPTFVIDGTPISGALPLETFRDILDLTLNQKGVTPPERG